MSRSTNRQALFIIALALAAVTYFTPPFHRQPTDVPLHLSIFANHSSPIIANLVTNELYHRHLQHRTEIYGHAVPGPSVSITTLRRARERVSESDIPFLLETPFTSSETIYNILTTCYGLRGKRYLDPREIVRDENVITRNYVSAHVKPPEGDEYFHFVSSPHYQEGVKALFSREHRGRIFLMMRHPCEIAESMYLSRPGSVEGDVNGLLNYTMSTEYYDNLMTRMITNIPPSQTVTEENFVEARRILENKFLIGMTSDLSETIFKRIKLYFGWKALPTQQGCELNYIEQAKTSLPQLALVDHSHEWRQIRKRNHYDMKLYARAMSVFANQKMGMPVHDLVQAEERRVASMNVLNLRDVSEGREKTDIPLFWHIPKASGTTVKETLSECYNLIRTEMIRPPSSLDIIAGSNVLNVDLSTSHSVAAAIEIGLAKKNLADVFVSQLVEAGGIFTPERKGRAFTILRHPVKLAASLFYYRRIATWEPTYRPEYMNITLLEYIKMDGYYDNWMVRMLSNAKIGGLNKDHLELAKSTLKQKFIIGMAEHMDETFKQLEVYFGWKENEKGCVQEHLHRSSNKNKYPELQRGGPVWDAIAEKNKFDMALYYYGLEIFGIQSDKIVGGKAADVE